MDEGAAIRNTLAGASGWVAVIDLPEAPRKERETIMKTTNTIQHALFRMIDSLDRQTLRDGHAVRERLIQAALQLTPFLYATVAQHIDMLVTE